MKLRLLVEYAAKAQYFQNHPDYALYMMTINRAESVRDRATNSRMVPPDKIAKLEAAVAREKEQYSRVARLNKLKFSRILTELATRDEYEWLYGAPSTIIHGDPEGMEHVLDADKATGRITPKQFPIERVNAMMVDAGTNTAMFCDTFITCFHPADESLRGRLENLHNRFRVLILKHPHGRDEEALEQIRSALKSNVADSSSAI
jgi:hypothetical protein